MRTTRACALVLASIALLASGCASTRHAAGPTSTTATMRTTTTVTTTSTIGSRRPNALVSALQSSAFTSSLPARLRVLGVGAWHYVDAGHVGKGYVGSAQVRLRSATPGESVSAIYDVFTTASEATASYATASSNFRRYSPPGTVRSVRLAPAVSAFCAPQTAPPRTVSCWFVHDLTTATVTATTPPNFSGDSDIVMQALLAHLLALGG